MKIAYYNLVETSCLPASMASDYQSDMLFHGLRTVLGSDCVDVRRMWWMYAHDKATRPEDFKKIWGKGFTMYGLLEDIPIYRGADQHFDKIVIPLHHTVVQHPDVVLRSLQSLGQQFNLKDVVLVDGWDRTVIDATLLQFCQENGIKYFKRELDRDIEGVYPISFAFPEEKIPTDAPLFYDRIYDIAPLIPVNQSVDPSYMKTYIYETEESYYNMYQNSKFALTSKKGGWDTLRHYEIMANGCIPIFVDFERCPKNTLHSMSRGLLAMAKRAIGLKLNLKDREWELGMELKDCSEVVMDNPGSFEANSGGEVVGWLLQKEFMRHLKQDLTTKALANRFLETINA